MLSRSIVIDHLTTGYGDGETGFGFVYCDYNDTENQTALELIAALAKQLAMRKTKPSRELEELYDSLKKDGRRPNLRQLTSLLRAHCNEFKHIFLIVDALDECEVVKERHTLVSTLLSLQSHSAKILVSSRPNLEDLRKQLIHVPQISIVATESDIRTYVQQKLEENQVFKSRISKTPHIENLIVDVITESASGM